jgi:pimeloyl-ACP methyl ester carboxylesterase
MSPAPPVVLLHGFASSFDHGWARQGWPDLLGDAGRAVVPVELLGHGRSDRPHDPAAYAAVPEHAAAQFPDGEVDAIGFSAGAITLVRIAAEQPARFRRLVLLGIGDGVLGPADGRQPGDRPGALIAVLAGEAAPPVEDVTGTVFRRMADAEGNDRRALVAFLQGFPAHADEAALATVRAPALVVVGDRDAAHPAARLAGALPAAELLVVPGLDHFATPADFRVIEAALGFLEA